jgi:hypothetical protein
MPPTNGVAKFAARKASAKDARLKAAFHGPSKSGKTFLSLVTATELIKTLDEFGGLKGNGRIIVIDSENGRSEEHYGSIIDFDIYTLDDFSPQDYINAIDGSIREQYSVIIIDQISHEWDGKGGILEIHNQATNNSKSKNSFMAWGDTTPKHNEFIDRLVRCPAHLICTMRAKQQYELTSDENNKLKPVKLGMGPIQRNTTEYEFDIVGSIDQQHVLTMETRGELSLHLGNRQWSPGKDLRDPGEQVKIGRIIGEWICGRRNAIDNAMITRSQVDELRSMGDQLGIKQAKWKALYARFNVSSLDHLTSEQFVKIKGEMAKAISQLERSEA